MTEFDKKVREWALMVENNMLDGNDNEHVISEVGPHLTYTEVELSPEEYSNGMKWYPFYLLQDMFFHVNELADGIKNNEPWATKDDNDGVKYYPSDGSIILHDFHSGSWGRFYSSSVRLVNEHPDNAKSAVVGFVDVMEKLFDYDLLYVECDSFMEGKIPRNIVSNIHDNDIELKKYHPNQEWPVDYCRFTISPGNYEIKIPGFLDITVTIIRDFMIEKQVPQTRNLTPTKQNTQHSDSSEKRFFNGSDEIPHDKEVYEAEDPELAKHLKKQSHILTMIYRKYLRKLLREFQSENFDISFTFDLYDSDPIRFPVISSTRVCVDGKVTQELINAIEGIARTLENTRCEDIFDEIATFVDGGGIEYDTSTDELIQDWRDITEKHPETNQEFIFQPNETTFNVLIGDVNQEKVDNFSPTSNCKIILMSSGNSLEPRLEKYTFRRPVSWIQKIPKMYKGGTKPVVVFNYIMNWLESHKK